MESREWLSSKKISFLSDPLCSAWVDTNTKQLCIEKWDIITSILLTQEQADKLIQQKESDSQEIERKFVVDWNKVTSMLAMQSADKKDIDQHYLFLWDNKEVRVRRKVWNEKNIYEFTIKIWAGEMRWEYNLILSAEQYQELLSIKETSLIKTRHVIHDTQWKELEFDVYGWDLHGLHIQEIEFNDLDTSHTYDVPPYVIREVTQDPRFKNAALSKAPLHTILRTDELADVLHIPFVSPGVGIEHIVARASAQYDQNKTPVVVRVAGWSASGKTSAVANKIAQGLPWSIIISLDDYQKGSTFVAEQQALWRTITYDEPSYVNLSQAAEDIKKLKEWESISKPTFDFQTGEPWNYQSISPAPYIVVEGIFALHDEASLGESLAVFVDASTHGRALRRLLRDIKRTPMTAHEILDYFFSIVEPMHRKHIQSTIGNADLIINNDYDAPSESLRAPNREKQTKIKVSNAVDIVPLLEKLGAKHIMHTSQGDTYFETDTKTEEIVRIRREGDHYQFSYKWPLLEDGYKHTYDCKTDVSMMEILQSSYNKNPITVSKDRSLYSIDGHIVSVDTNIHINNKHIDETLLEIRDADIELQEKISTLLWEKNITSTILPQMSYVKYAKKFL